MNKIIRFNDGVEVEVEVDSNKAHEIADTSDVDNSIEKLNHFISKVVEPVSKTYNELTEKVEVDSMKLKIGVKIGVEGNFILAKSSTSANLEVEITLKSKKELRND